MSANLRAFLALISWCEGTSGPDGYRTIVGGELFTDFGDHPRILKSGTFANGKYWSSTAAGKYQFLKGTWDECREACDLPDFSPDSQDKAAIFLIKRANALHAVEDGDLRNAIHLCNKTWASLPGSPYGQPIKSYADCERIYLAAGGQLSQAAGPAPPQGLPETPVAEPPAPIEEKRSTMPLPVAAVAALGVELLKLLPFARKPENSSAVEKIGPQLVELAKQAAGPGLNEQAAVEAVQRNPQVQQAFVSAAVSKWSDLAPQLEFESRERKAAREADIAFVETKQNVWRSPSFLVSCMLLPLVYLGMVSVSLKLPILPDWPNDARMAIISLVVGMVLGGVVGYYFGMMTSANRPQQVR